jgi:hypothetical protein
MQQTKETWKRDLKKKIKMLSKGVGEKGDEGERKYADENRMRLEMKKWRRH